ncbi:hypothetical protein CSA17_03500 [bacterium DOLJORAL78_65_58]|nr:MAG: hypothetical protein CSA17_03500 [bacterium DOLJORAL78_65_58]
MTSAPAPPPAPWSDLATLQHLGADLRAEWLGRRVYRVSVGPAWLRVHWQGQDRTGLLLSLWPGAVLAAAGQGGWPPPVRKALPLVKDHLLNEHLPGARLTGLGVYPADRIWALRFANAADQTLYLLHQVFGPRGNTTLLDEDTRLIWARNHPPHPLLHRRPPAQTWSPIWPEPTKAKNSAARPRPWPPICTPWFRASPPPSCAICRTIRP